MNSIRLDKENLLNKLVVPIIALIAFLTWFLKVPESVNIGIYLAILLALIVFKASNIMIVIFTLFSAAATYYPMLTNSVGTKSHILFMIIFGAYALYILIRSIIKKEIPKGKIVFPLLAIISYVIISLIWTIDFVGGLSELGSIIFGYLAYFIIRNDKNKKVDFYQVSWYLTLFLLVISLQYVVLTYDVFPFEGKGPLYKFWGYQNLVAGLVGISFVPSLYKYFAKDKSKLRFLYLPLELLVLYSIYVSKSEALYASLIVAVLFIPLLLFVKNRKLLFGLTISGMIGFILVMLFFSIFKDNFLDLYNKIDLFSSSRLSIYRSGFIILKNPFILIFGRGAGSAHLLLQASGYPFYYFHSWIVHILVQRGLIGLTLMIITFYMVFKVLKNSNSKFKYFATIAFVIYLAFALIDIIFEYQYIGTLFYFLVAIIENSSEQHLEIDLKDESTQSSNNLVFN